jgi:hypothetical protein
MRKEEARKKYCREVPGSKLSLWKEYAGTVIPTDVSNHTAQIIPFPMNRNVINKQYETTIKLKPPGRKTKIYEFRERNHSVKNKNESGKSSVISTYLGLALLAAISFASIFWMNKHDKVEQKSPEDYMRAIDTCRSKVPCVLDVRDKANHMIDYLNKERQKVGTEERPEARMDYAREIAKYNDVVSHADDIIANITIENPKK